MTLGHGFSNRVNSLVRLDLVPQSTIATVPTFPIGGWVELKNFAAFIESEAPHAASEAIDTSPLVVRPPKVSAEIRHLASGLFLRVIDPNATTFNLVAPLFYERPDIATLLPEGSHIGAGVYRPRGGGVLRRNRRHSASQRDHRGEQVRAPASGRRPSP